MQCSELESVFEREGLSPLSAEAREHLAQCSACGMFVAEVTSIVALAHELPAEIDPPTYIWASLHKELVTEGVIHEVHQDRQATPWWQSFVELFRNRGLATAAVAAMVIVLAVFAFKAPRVPPIIPDPDFERTVTVLTQQENDLANMRLASSGQGMPVSAVDTSLQQNLQQVDEFIADCQRHLKEVPSDELAREYLTNAYQQKAELLSTMIDRGGSLN